jgi:hypothetical protein
MTEKELARGAARRLAIIRHAQEVTGNVSLTCRYYGITRKAYYTWLRRYVTGWTNVNALVMRRSAVRFRAPALAGRPLIHRRFGNSGQGQRFLDR